MGIVRLRDFSGGLWLDTQPDNLPANALFRARGLHADYVRSLRSRNGSSLIHSLAAHSLAYFNSTWYSGVGTALYSGSSSIKTGLNGNRLALIPMAPRAGIVDYLFCAGGGSLFKVDSADNVTNWGIEAPSSDPSAATGAAGALTGTYKYKVTFYNSTTGNRPNANPNAAEVSPSSQKVDLSSIPSSSDGQVDKVEIWRTQANGSRFFRLTTISNGTTSYTDNAADDQLESTELPTDNLKPYAWFDDALGPHNASMFWLSRTQSGKKGRVYYSPVGRAESVQGYIDITDDGEPLQKLFSFQGKLGVLSVAGAYEILGTNPYTFRPITGAPGTDSPHATVSTPLGLVYASYAGIVLLSPQIRYVSDPSLTPLFDGRSRGALNSFDGLVAASTKRNYYVSDGSQTLALDASTLRWRDVGIGCSALHYADEADVLGASFDSKLYSLEAEGYTKDGNSSIALDWEPAHIKPSPDADSWANWVHIDADTNNQQLTVEVVIDGVYHTLGKLQTDGRAVCTFAVNRPGRTLGIRLTGNLISAAEVFDIAFEGTIQQEST